MAYSICDNCGGEYHWDWSEAFDKFGFNDGDGQVETHNVADFVRDHGYEVITEEWGMHNTVIVSIKKDGNELVSGDDEIDTGYDNPREYLPQKIIDLLDKVFPSI